MAKILPSDWRAVEATGAAGRELETLGRLEATLPDSVTVFHGVHWTRVEHGFATIGEIDFVVIAPSGRLLLIEQKTGFLDETAEGLVKRHVGGRRNIRLELDRTLDALRKRLAPVTGGEPPAIDYLLYCPDYAVREPGSAGLDPAQIVDSQAKDGVARRVGELLQLGRRDEPGDLPLAEPERPELVARLRRFFANELELVPDVSALLSRAEALVTRLSGGLATWARRLEAPALRLRVVGTAGSGKTQLALALLEDAERDERRVLYACFNRPLADHLREIAPDPSRVFTYHQWCERRLRSAGRTIEFGGPDSFARMEREAAALPVDDREIVDDLIVDEGQDFAAGWREDLFRLIGGRPDSRIFWLEDPLQNLYGREPFAGAGWTVMHAPANYRSPRSVVRALGTLLGEHAVPGLRAESPIDGAEVEYLVYEDDDEMLDATKRAITAALRAGFRKQDIVLVTWSGRSRSQLLGAGTLGPHRLQAFAGRYDIFGNPEYREGDLLVDSVYRFKGQSAPCVIFTEVDFETFDASAARKLFVGMTRASMRLAVVLSGRAARQLPLPGNAGMRDSSRNASA
ncbi:MAG: ATP-binding domain-containing protein [Burkholderiaceae bacterium]